MTDLSSTFEQSIRTAVAQGRAELTRLDSLADAVAENIARSRRYEPNPSDSSSQLDELLRGFMRDLRRHLDHERDALSSFNIVFFGRTGAGKSTLMSAFGGLDGGYVSPGASDWTTGVHHVQWHDCRLFDTPGINGWGRTESRENLEATARRAVETADIVLLCFDSQNQQAMEFVKISSWIRNYGKPAVAVLNVRNSRWRHPALVPDDQRQHLSDSVRQHADNIRTELAQIGLGSTPLVAIQSRRALFARATTPFRGPAPESFQHERDEFGIEYLARWSNIRTLEQLLTTAIQSGASDIRLSALREDVRERCREASHTLATMADDFVSDARRLEDGIESILAVIGYPTASERENHLKSSAAGSDFLDTLENLQGHAFNSLGKGSLDRFVRHQAASHLAAQRRHSNTQAQLKIAEAFDTKQTIDEAAFRAAVFNEQAIDSAITDAWGARGEFLIRELEVTAEQDFEQDLSSLLNTTSFVGIGGEHTAGDILRGAGIAVGLAGVAVPFAVANFWNPAGWAVGLAAVGVGIAGQVQQHFGKKMKVDAQKKANEARAQAIADATDAVEKTYDAYEEAIVVSSRAASWGSLAPIISESLRESIALRNAHQRALHLAKQLTEQAESITTTHAVGGILTRAQSVMAESSAELRTLLLGEDWIRSDHRHEAERELDEAVLITYLDRAAEARSALRTAFTKAWTCPSPDAIRLWAEELDDASLNDSSLLEVAKEMRRVARHKPSFAVLGDYNSGKTSLIRRILLEAGDLADQDGLEILARPATATEQRYEFPRLELIDTPGLQSRNTSHDDRAFAAITESSLTFVVVHVNLLVGNTAVVEEIATGSSMVAAKADRLIFLINRSDELGADPLLEPHAFLNLQNRKKEELIAALAAKSITIEEASIHCVAADPFGLVGNSEGVTADDFEANRVWDGTDSLIGAITDLSDSSLAAGSLIAGFDTAVTLLKRRRNFLRTELDAYTKTIQKRASAIATLAAAEADAAVLHKSLSENAERLAGTAVLNAATELYQVAVGDNAGLDRVANSWTEDPRLRSAIDRYAAAAEKELLSWQEEHASMIEREFRGIDSLNDATAASDFSSNRATGTVDGIIGGAGNVAEHAAKAAKILGNRDAVYAIGKQFGHKFKPWGAVKGGARVAKFGVVLGAVAAAADAKGMLDDSKKSETHRNNLDAATQMIEDQATQLVVQITEGDKGSGPIGFLDGVRKEVRSLIERTAAEEAELIALRDATAFKNGIADRLVSSALQLQTAFQDEEM
ncbi:GTPase [Gordonia sp. NPDC003504]